MILLDLSQILYSTIMAGIKDREIDEDFLRHITLNTIRANYHKFKQRYGSNMIIATDSKENWRRSVFPYYKASRAKAKAKSPLDWPRIHAIMDQITAELSEFFPYPVVQVVGAEGDDIIATLCFAHSTSEKVLIVSADKDFAQLQILPFVHQYDPIRKKDVITDNPVRFLKEHVIRGDVSDGIPNILSADSVFATNARQSPMTAQRLNGFMEVDPNHYDFLPKRNYYRNEQLINLSNIPVKLATEIISKRKEQKSKSKGKLFQYFIDKGLKGLMQDIGDF